MSVNKGDWDSAVVVVAWPVIAVMAVEAVVGLLVIVTGIGAIVQYVPY